MGPVSPLSGIKSHLASLNNEIGRGINPLPLLPIVIIRKIFTYLWDSPQTIKNLAASCWKSRQMITSHPFIVLADSIYRLAHAKEEDIPQLLMTLSQPENTWKWTTFTQEEKRVLQELDPQGVGFGRFLEHSPFLSSFDPHVLQQILEHVAWQLPQVKENSSDCLKDILTKGQRNLQFIQEKANDRDWQEAGEILLRNGLYHIVKPRPTPESVHLIYFHEIVKHYIKEVYQLGRNPFVHLAFATQWIGEFDGLSLQYAPDELKKQKELVLKAVHQNGLALEWASPELKDDPEVVLQAVQENIQAIRFASNRLQIHPTFSKMHLLKYFETNTHPNAILAVVKTNALALTHVPRSLKRKRSFMEQVALENPSALALTSKKFKEDLNFLTEQSFLLKALEKNPEAMALVPDELKENKFFLLQALERDPEIYPLITEQLANDLTFAFEAVKKNLKIFHAFPRNFAQANECFSQIVTKLPPLGYIEDSEKLKTLAEIFSSIPQFNKDKQLALEMLKLNAGFFSYINSSLRKNQAFVLAAIQQNAWVLSCVDPEWRKDRAIVLAAIHQNGLTLQYADPDLKKDRDIVLTAVQQNGKAFQYADSELTKDREIVLAAVKKFGQALWFADPSLKNDRDIVLAAVKQNGKALSCAALNLQNDPEIVSAASSTMNPSNN